MILNNNTLAIPNELKSKDDSSLSKTVVFKKPNNITPAFDFKLLKHREYDDIEIVKWFDGKPNKEFNKIILHPIESVHFMEFKNTNKNVPFMGFQLQFISKVRIIEDIKKRKFLTRKKR